MRVLVCGGRDMPRHDAFNWLEANLEDEIRDKLDCFTFTIEVIIQGGARGADQGAADWGKSENLKVLTFPADWKKHGKAAGPIRNRKMIEEGKPDVVVALPGGRGTANMVRLAEEFGLPVIKASYGLSAQVA